MNSILEAMYFLVTNDPQYNIGSIRDEFLGEGLAENAIFTDTFITSLLITGAISGLFYLLGHFLPLNKIWLWLLLLLAAAGACFAFSCNFIGNAEGLFPPPDPIASIGWKYVGMTTFYSGVYFFLFSLFFKSISKVSSFTKHFPF